MFVLLFGFEDVFSRNSFDSYYMPLIETKNFNVIIGNKPCFDKLMKSKQEAYKKLVEICRNNSYTTENLFYYSYHQNYYELIGIDLSRQTNTSILQQIYFVRKYCENIFYDWKAAGISLDLLNVTG